MSSVSSSSMAQQQPSAADCIDFDLQLEDYSKITVLVKNLRGGSAKARAEAAKGSEADYLCDVFGEKECHHGEAHHLRLDSLQTARCQFCQFVEHLRSCHSHVPVLQSKSGSLGGGGDKQPHLSLRYKHSLTSEIVEWCDLQPWRSPYALFAHASCASKEDIMAALEGFEQLKSQFKKTLIVSKLFIDVSGSGAQLESGLDERMKLLNANPYNISTLNIDDEIKKSNFIIEKNLSNFSFNRNSSIFQFDLEAAEKQEQSRNASLNRHASIFQQGKAQQSLLGGSGADLVLSGKSQESQLFDEAEFSKKLKFHQSDMVYFDGLSGAEGIGESKAAKIELTVQESMSVIFYKLLNMANRISVSEEKQLNYYSELLKTPVETSDEKKASSSLQTTSSFLSIKLFNRKIVAARMLKYKADLYLSLNMIDSAFVFYAQAYAATKKEGDTFWAIASLEGLLVLSYLFLRDQPAALSGHKAHSSSFKSSWKNKFSSSKDLNKLAIQFDEFPKNYYHVINTYNRHEDTRFLALEASLMAAKLFVQFGMKTEGLGFVNYSIYICNLQMREEARIRRYYEISEVYKTYEMKRLSALYKWISSCRVFRLMQKRTWTSSQLCLISRCAYNLIGTFDIMKLGEQARPVAGTRDQLAASRGFPKAKKHMITQTVDIFGFLNQFQEAHRFSKYLVNELTADLSGAEIAFYEKVVRKTLLDKSYAMPKLYDTFKSKFFQFPKLNFFEIKSEELGMNKVAKIKALATQASGSLYIHRYENPLLSARVKKVHSMRAGEFKQIGVSFTNPVPASLCIDSLSLIVESCLDQTKFSVLLSTADEKKQRGFEVPSQALNGYGSTCEETTFQMAFQFEHLGRFRIIGYEIQLWNDSNRILFKDLVPENESRLKAKLQGPKTAALSLQSTYEIELFPRIPVAKAVHFLAQDANENLELADTLSESKTPELTARLGIAQQFLLKLEFTGGEEEAADIVIEECSCFVLNEANLARFKASVAIANTQDTCCLTVDSREASLDASVEDASCLELPCMLEIKYSNKAGREQNLCHTLRKQIQVKLVPLVSATIDGIKEIGADKFQLEFTVQNLQESSAHICLGGERTELAKHSSQSLTLQMNKLDIFERLNAHNFNQSISEMFNAALSRETELCVDEQTRLNLRFENTTQLLECRDLVVKCPLAIEGHLTLAAMDESSDLRLAALALVVGRGAVGSDCLQAYDLTVSIGDKKKNKLLNAYKRLIKASDLESSGFWLNEYRVVLASVNDGGVSEQNKLKVQLQLASKDEGKRREASLKWAFWVHLSPCVEKYTLCQLAG